MVVLLGTFVVFLCAGTFRLIFSSASLLSAWKSGWRKVQLYGEKNEYPKKKKKTKEKKTYMFTKDIIIGIFDFMKIVFIQLSNETRKI